jgi:hypothetical protein
MTVDKSVTHTTPGAVIRAEGTRPLDGVKLAYAFPARKLKYPGDIHRLLLAEINPAWN